MSATSIRKAFQRLPSALKPLHYNIRLKPDLKAFTFKGWMSVDLEVVKETSSIVCNAAELNITSLKLNQDMGQEDGSVIPANFELDEKSETLKIKLDNPLVEGCKAKMVCTYTGILNDRMKGFYRSKYTSDGEERYCAVTQFEATDARRCFPCWDEPEWKATFSISIVAPQDRTVHSNMPEKEETVSPLLDNLSDGEVSTTDKVVNFAKSPIMSTYLVAIVVGEFEQIEGKTSGPNPIQVRVFTPKGKTEQGDFALKTSVRALEYYSEFFGVKYPLPKYDCIAIADFQCGAMENWGLVTYRESCVLVDPENTSSASKQWIAIVVNHEMGHMWFGNLVTMKWWTHLWLNEGFASFMENKCTDTLFPEFDLWTQFVADTLIAALELDALANSHPIEVEVGHPSEVDEIFDNISYNKGASVIRMLHNFIGDESFRRGMKHYLETFAYKNAETEDLWKSLEQASGKPVGKVMSTWTSQMGFPVVKVESMTTTGGRTSLALSQEKFNADGSTSDNYLWNIPMNVVTSTSTSDDTQKFLMSEKQMTIDVDNPSEGWVKLNNDFTGFFRVHYADEVLDTLMSSIANGSLSELNRLSVLDDMMALVRSGRVQADVPLKVIKSCPHEKSYVVWRCINHFFSKVKTLISEEEFFAQFNDFIKSSMSEIVDHVGWNAKPDEHHTFGLLRMLVITRMGTLGHEATVKEARSRFEKHIKQEESIPADLRAPVYRVVAANGGIEEFKQMLALYKSSELSEEKDRISRAMGSFPTEDILNQVLSFSIGNDVRAQDTPFVVGGVAANPKGKEIAWQFYQKNFKMFLERYKTGSLMASLIKFTTDSFVHEDKALEIEKFFKDNENPAERTVKQSLETIRLNVSWLKRDRENIQNFLNNL